MILIVAFIVLSFSIDRAEAELTQKRQISARVGPSYSCRDLLSIQILSSATYRKGLPDADEALSGEEATAVYG